MKSPILVTGAPRSGTTFLGKMLALPRQIGYVREPFNFQYGMEGITTYFPYLVRGVPEEQHYHQLIKSLLEGSAKFKKLPVGEATSVVQRLGRRFFSSGSAFSYFKATHDPRVRRLLVKDPLAALASEYFLREFDAQVVVIMRHPGATVASMKRLGWGHDFRGLTNQTQLMQDFLRPILKEYDTANLSQLEQQALLWLCTNTVLAAFIKRNPEIIFIKHEELSADPGKVLGSLYGKLGLPFTEQIRSQVREHTAVTNPTDPGSETHLLRRNSRENIGRWKTVLAREEIARVREITEPLAGRYYTAESWNV